MLAHVYATALLCVTCMLYIKTAKPFVKNSFTTW